MKRDVDYGTPLCSAVRRYQVQNGIRNVRTRLASEFGVSRTTFWKWMKTGVVPVDYLLPISTKLNVPIEDLNPIARILKRQ